MDVKQKLLREVAEAGLPAGPAESPVVTEADLAALPVAAQKYLRFMRVPGRPRDWSFRLRADARFRMGPDQPWKSTIAWQYNTRLEVARFFYMQLRFFGVPVQGRDIYVHGQGRLLVRALDLVTVEDAAGPELDAGELVTYLNDAILFAPSMLLGPETIWTDVDASTFDVTLADHGHRVSGRVFLDERGAVRDFSTEDRYFDDRAHHAFVRRPWHTPIDGWREENGRVLPTSGRAVWQLPEGELAYADFVFSPGDASFNVAPGA